jgi:hypothetical protein
MIAKPGARSSPSTINDLTRLIFPLTVGAAVAVTLGLYGRLHSPTGLAVSVPGFSGPQTVKVWLGTAAVLFAVLQPLSAAVLYGRMPPRSATPWAGAAHRWSGRIAFLLSVPVAVHCLYALGFQAVDTRVIAHSLLGCLFYGAFTTKMLLLTRRGLAGWVLPAVGGVVFAGLIGLWITSSLWFFTEHGVIS